MGSFSPHMVLYIFLELSSDKLYQDSLRRNLISEIQKLVMFININCFLLVTEKQSVLFKFNFKRFILLIS